MTRFKYDSLYFKSVELFHTNCVNSLTKTNVALKQYKILKALKILT